MKNKLIIGASIILVIVIASVLIIIVRNKSTEKSLNGDNYFISESAKEYRTCELAGEEVQLEYSNTEIDSTLDVDKAYNDILNDRFKLSFGVYDVYKDSTDRKFIFIIIRINCVALLILAATHQYIRNFLRMLQYQLQQNMPEIILKHTNNISIQSAATTMTVDIMKSYGDILLMMLR